MKIGYVLKKFPRYSETFIMREVLELEAQEVPVQIFSLNLPKDGRFHGSLAKLQHTVWYSPELKGFRNMQTVLGKFSGDKEARSRISQLFWEYVEENRFTEMKYLGSAVLLAEEIRDQEIAHLHAHFSTSACEVARMAARIAQVPFSFTAHAKDIYAESVDHSSLKKKVVEASSIVTVCDANVTYLQSLFPDHSTKIKRIYNGIDLAKWHAPPRQGTQEVPRILAVGRFVPKKGFGLLVDALGQLKRDGFSFKASILGDGELWGSIQEQVNHLGLGDDVALPGAASAEQIRIAMSEADLLVCPSVEAGDGDRDALPTVLVEALGMHCPVVTTPIGGIAEIVDNGKAGALVEPELQSLVEGIGALLRDPKLRQQFAIRGRSRAEALFDGEKSASTLRELFLSTAPPALAEVAAL